nr:diaminobutyrate acetyltransferase [Lysinibacillus timonensis]
MSQKQKASIGLKQFKQVTFCVPTVDDGQEIWQLIKDTSVLDVNSPYQYLLWSKYFAETSVVVKCDGKIVGFISGFIEPTAEDALFIWQVAVDESVRGNGIALRMLKAILCRPVCQKIRYLEATVTPSNEASAAMFKKLARDLDAQINVFEGFKEELFPSDVHEPEQLFRIGPFSMNKG